MGDSIKTKPPSCTAAVTIPAEGHARRVAGLRQKIHQITDEVIDAGKFHYGSQTRHLEEAIQQAWGGHPVATTSCTQAMILALQAARTRPGDEVIIPAATFIATAFSVSAVGAIPVIVDVTEPTFTLPSPSVLRPLSLRSPAVPAQ
ncbi:DegT/DnrJ/EryC1/StrS family aminotransferase [Streptomyces sp. NPDC001817]|uniref:DegT/DnrJ/EryC1/StrS family aminotransferase n=1 Tax=Streptomyces sp. NPDC001817 TaxID=3154398 RepID=UPI0033190A2F